MKRYVSLVGKVLPTGRMLVRGAIGTAAGAVVGGAIGTVVMPGPGTLTGASYGGIVGGFIASI